MARPVDNVLLGCVGARGRRSRAATGAQGRRFFLDALDLPADGRLLDVGCGWGAALARPRRRPGLDAVGLTLSAAQQGALRPVLGRRAEVRLRPGRSTRRSARYDGILSFGAFEHFARDGTDRSNASSLPPLLRLLPRVAGPGGRLGLETIAHDDAPDTAAVKGRGPLGDAVLELFPESLCPHLPEIVLGFEPWFRLEVLRSDAADFARTFRAWSVRLRGAERRGGELVGADTVTGLPALPRRPARSQFRTGTLTNYRLVLRRRETPHRPASAGPGLDGESGDH